MIIIVDVYFSSILSLLQNRDKYSMYKTIDDYTVSAKAQDSSISEPQYGCPEYQEENLKPWASDPESW